MGGESILGWPHRVLLDHTRISQGFPKSWKKQPDYPNHYLSCPVGTQKDLGPARWEWLFEMFWRCAMFIVGDKRGFSFPLATLGKESSETLAQIDGAWKMGDWQFVPCFLNQWWLLVLMRAGQKKIGTRKWSGPVDQPRLSLLGPTGVPAMSHLSSRPGIKYQLQLSCWYLT